LETTLTLLDLQDVWASYGDSTVLRGISLRVQKGSVVSLLGRNGMGKSTTVKTIVGVLRATQGEVRLRGEKISGLSAWRVARSGIGWVPEGRRVFTGLTVEENLRVVERPSAGGAHGSDWSLQSAYELFPRLKERRSNPAGALSGGEQQMLAIARALSTNPELLILDEATEGLAPLVRVEIWNALRALKGRGQSILIIDKHLHALASLADYHYVVEKGQIAWSGDGSALERDMTAVKQRLSVSA
jgi:branched-chain amino acid transport system ATP-binding protein